MARAQAIKPVRPDSLSKQVCDTLRDAIFAGRFEPGEPLRELHLAKMFEVSQATIREALVQLEQSGLVVREKNRKTTVTSFTSSEIRERLIIRVVLEELALVLAAANMAEADWKKLSGLTQAVQRAIDKGNWREVTMSDLRFHRFLWEKSDSPVLVRTLEQLTTPLFAYLGRMHEKAATPPSAGRPHEVLVEALRSRDEDLIRESIRAHVEGSYRKLLGVQAGEAQALESRQG